MHFHWIGNALSLNYVVGGWKRSRRFENETNRPKIQEKNFKNIFLRIKFNFNSLTMREMLEYKSLERVVIVLKAPANAFVSSPPLMGGTHSRAEHSNTVILKWLSNRHCAPCPNMIWKLIVARCDFENRCINESASVCVCTDRNYEWIKFPSNCCCCCGRFLPGFFFIVTI